MSKLIHWAVLSVFLLIFGVSSVAQNQVSGKITSHGDPLAFANVILKGTSQGASADIDGNYVIKNVPDGTYVLVASYTGFESQEQELVVFSQNPTVNFELTESNSLDEIVITGTLKPVMRQESPVPVEVYTPAFLKKNPVPSIFDALQNVNGVRPQLNCNVCNTGDIHINGLEGPYTLVLIDGMPIVSGLSTVYGLSGIPTSLIDRVEIVKGPASSLYGSEAVGGLINVITKLPEYAPALFAESHTSSWGETNADIGFKYSIGNATGLFGANYYNYSNPIDNNNDNFTDVTLQDRISIFNKWSFKRDHDRMFSLAARFYYEDRWGGELQWNPTFRGGDEVYGESIYTARYEFLGTYQLPVEEKMLFNFSYTDHDQNSVYGNTPYLAQQRIGFGQLTWDKAIGSHDLLFGAAGRYNYYDDNTTATANQGQNDPDEVFIPSIFAQDEIKLAEKHTLLLGARYDYDSRHGSIFTPRIAYRWKVSDNDIFRVNAGTGFRVVNLFTEEHAALTGARDVVIQGTLDPEQSYNINLNYLKKIVTGDGIFMNVESSAWYTYFTNAILPDYDTNPNQIIYDNLNGHAASMGVSANLDVNFYNRLKILVGATIQDVSQTEDEIRTRQILTERFTGTWSVSYRFFKPGITIDYTGNIYGPMRLPLLGPLDPRPEFSPTWSIQNIQLTYKDIRNFEMFAGVKNLLDWTPNKSAPFLIARADDPFDENVQFDANGDVVPTADNPYALTFDPSYVYGPNQGIRAFLGLRYTIQ